jgi:hypothetical protein
MNHDLAKYLTDAFVGIVRTEIYQATGKIRREAPADMAFFSGGRDYEKEVELGLNQFLSVERHDLLTSNPPEREVSLSEENEVLRLRVKELEDAVLKIDPHVQGSPVRDELTYLDRGRKVFGLTVGQVVDKALGRPGPTLPDVHVPVVGLQQYVDNDRGPLRPWLYDAGEGWFGLPDFVSERKYSSMPERLQAYYFALDDDWYAIDRGRVKEGKEGAWGRWPLSLGTSERLSLPPSERALYVASSPPEREVPPDGEGFKMMEALIPNWGRQA